MIANLPVQPSLVISYLRVGRLLYASLLLFILESWFYGWELFKAFYEAPLWVVLFWGWCFLFSFVHIYLVVMDGWSRYQDYKRAKDLFYMYGFESRIAVNFIGSKCQRMAAMVAAEELGIASEVNNYYTAQGVKWYHYIPYFMLREPLFLFKKDFWSRTFLEKNYQSKFDFRNLQVTIPS